MIFYSGNEISLKIFKSSSQSSLSLSSMFIGLLLDVVGLVGIKVVQHCFEEQLLINLKIINY